MSMYRHIIGITESSYTVVNEHGLCIQRDDGVLEIIEPKQDGKEYIIIQQPRATGKWEEFTCSECGFTPLIKPMELNITKGFMKCTYNYCPDCGAKMESEE